MLYPCVLCLSQEFSPLVARLITRRMVLFRLLNEYQAANDRESKPLINGLLRAAVALCASLEDCRLKVGDTIDYPFEHAQEDVTLARFVVPSLPDKDDVVEVLQAGDEAINRLGGLYTRAPGPPRRDGRGGRTRAGLAALGVRRGGRRQEVAAAPG